MAQNKSSNLDEDFSFDPNDTDFGDFNDATELSTRTNKPLPDFEDDVPGSVTSLETVKPTVEKDVVITTKTKAKDETKPKVDKKEDKKEDDEDDDDEEEPVKDSDFDFSSTKPQPPVATDNKGKGKASKEENTDTGEGDGLLDEEETFTELARGLKERGILTIDIPKDKKLTEDEFFELHEKDFDLRLEEAIESGKDRMGEEGTALMKYVMKGGRVADFVQIYAENSFELEELDETDPKQVQKVLKYYVENFEDVDDDEVEEKIKFINDGGKATEKAIKYFKIIKAEEIKAKEDLQKEQTKIVEDRQKASKAMAEKVVKTLKSTDKVGIFPISKADQQKVADYINKPTIKVGKNNFVPPLIAKIRETLQGKTEEDLKRLVVLGKLFMTDFSPEDLLTEAETEVANKAQKGIQSGKLGFKVKSGSGGGTRKSFADYFEEEEVQT